MPIPLQTILTYFETDDVPTQEQFQASWSSFWHKYDDIPQKSIFGLESSLQTKADKQLFETHLSDPEAHGTYLAKKDASNLSPSNKLSWKAALGVGDLPSNIATIDEGVKIGNVFTKAQSYQKFMEIEDFLNSDGKILAEKIEALGLTTLIQSTQTTLAQFAANSGTYVFEDNDFIAIPGTGGVFSLYMFKGGVKTNTANYLPTGLSNITIAMVEGLQAALDNKVSKPSTPSYLTLWNGSALTASPIYTDGTKLGVGTTSPTEMLHLNNGRMRSKAIVLDENTENIPFQITYENRSFHGTDSTGTRKKLMYQTYADYLALISTFTDAQKDEVRLKLRKTNENYSLNQPQINNILPPIIDRSVGYTQYITLVGLNLFLDTITPGAAQIEIKNIATGTVTLISNFTSYQYSPDRLTFGLDFLTMPVGDYQFRVFHNNQWSLPNPDKLLRVRDFLTSLPMPSLTWELADSTGLKPSLPEATTSTDGIRLEIPSGLGNGRQVFAQSSEITTQQEMNDGVLLVFDFTAVGYDSPFHGDVILGFLTSTFNNTDYVDVGVQVYGDNASMKTKFLPSYTIKKILYNPGVIQWIVSDLLYVIIKNGNIEFLFLNKNVNSVETLGSNQPLRIKTTLKKITDNATPAKIEVKLINKYSLL